MKKTLALVLTLCLLMMTAAFGVAETADVANTIAFLLSPAAKFITGVTLPVDGGYTTC